MKKILVSLLAGLSLVLTGAPASALASEDNKGGRTQSWNAALPQPLDTAGRPKDVDIKWPAPPRISGSEHGLPTSARWAKDNHRVPPVPGQPTTLGTVTRDYGVGSQALTNQGMDGNVYMANPWVTFSDGSGGHSLGQFAVTSDSQQQILEWGYRKSYNGGNPKLFFSSWVSGVWQGYNNAAFHVTGTTPLPGDDIPAADLSTGKSMLIQWDGTQSCAGVTGIWWFAYAGNYKGYVCASNFPAATGLRTGVADFNQAFHEITMDTGSSHPGYYCSDSGNGKQGSLGNATAAYFASLRLFGNATTNPPTNFFVHTSPASPLFGRLSVAAQSNRTFSSGGPGSNAGNTAVGVNNAC